ncbi:MAG: hypothetical protein ACPIOQ_33705, partial [Promethearchaeia archaeon]
MDQAISTLVWQQLIAVIIDASAEAPPYLLATCFQTRTIHAAVAGGGDSADIATPLAGIVTSIMPNRISPA